MNTTKTKRELADEKRAARAAEIEARNEEKRRLEAELEEARARALQACKRPPQEFQEWGVIKTRCWRTVADRCRALARSKSKKDPRTIRDAADLLVAMGRWDAAQCAQYLETMRQAKAAAKQKRQAK